MGGKSSRVADYHIVVTETKPVLPELSCRTDLSSTIDTPASRPIGPNSPSGNPRETIRPTSGKARPSSAKSTKSKKRQTIATFPGPQPDAPRPPTTLVRATSFKRSSSKGNLLSLVRDNDDLLEIECSAQHPWLIKRAKMTDLPLKAINMGRVIGQGYMGTVRLCSIANSKYFVAKSIKKEVMYKNNLDRHVENEKAILTALQSPFCVKSFGVQEDKNKIYIFMEYVPGGELFRQLGRRRFFSSEEAKFYISEIFCGLEHMHRLGFVYRDLKPENIAVDEEGHIKLIDFGFSTSFNKGTRLRTNCGTPAYLSPEQLDGKLTNGYTHVVDWWAFGVLLYELLTGKTPFARSAKDSAYEIFLRILKNRIHFPRNFDKEAKVLVSALCNAYVENRLCDMHEIKRHQYFTVPWKAVQERRLVPPFVPELREGGDSHYFAKFDQ